MSYLIYSLFIYWSFSLKYLSNKQQQEMNSELEKQYSPRLWQKRFPENIMVTKHIEITKQESEKVRIKVPHQLNLRFDDNEEHLFDLYGKDLPKDAPLLVHLHGGYWRVLEKENCANMVLPLYSSGIRVAILEYQKAPKVTLNEIIEEVKVAAKYLLEMAKTMGSSGVWFSGHSAGAHLIACLLTSEEWIGGLNSNLHSLIKGFIMISGIYYLEPLVNTSINDPLKLTNLDAVRLSPFHNFKSLNNKFKNLNIYFLITVGEFESDSYKEQAKKFSKKLMTCYEGKMQIINGIDHFNIMEDLKEERFSLTQDIIQLIKLNKPLI